MRRLIRSLLVIAMVAVPLTTGLAQASDDWTIEEFSVDKDALCDLRDRWVDDVLATHERGTWAKLEMELSDDDLAAVGLPSADILRSRRYPTPTLVTQDGEFYDVPTSELRAAMQESLNAQLSMPPAPTPSTDPGNGNGNGNQEEGEETAPGNGNGNGNNGGGGSEGNGLPNVATLGGTGCLGIRPGGLLLTFTDSSIGWCSLAHVYGSPGAYSISTAGHCGNGGDPATMIAGFGNRSDVTGVILLDFGQYQHAVDGGLGNDYAEISIDPAYQSLTTPTMCFWGGPRGVYSATGSVVGVGFGGNNLLDPEITTDPNPFLAQTIVHYGHGTGIGAGGTPRVGEAISWGSDHFLFTGVITPGDSGSGSNTLLGDTAGANMQAAGINTHIWVDPLMRDGIGIMGGTRATKLGTPASGQFVPYPIPIEGLP